MDTKQQPAVTSLLLALVALTCLPQPLLATNSKRQQQQEPLDSDLKMSFQPVDHCGRVSIQCKFEPPVVDAEFVSFNLFDPTGHVAQFNFSCDDSQSQETSVEHQFSSGRLLPSSGCSGFEFAEVKADRDLSDFYLCNANVINIKPGLWIRHWSSKWVSSKVVADPKPPVARLVVKNAATGVSIGPDSEVAAGTNVSVFCKPALALPLSVVTVSVGDVGTGGNGRSWTSRASGRLRVFATVPREPRVTFSCRVYNGFGWPQTRSVTVTAVYGPVPGEVRTLQEASLESSQEVQLCSIRNNPPRRLEVRDLKPSSLADSVKISVDETKGLSMARVTLDPRSGRPGGLLVTFICGLEGSEFRAEGAAYVTGYCDQWSYCL